MREFEFSIVEGLTKGLRRFSTVSRNVETLIECHNWAPTDEGLEVHEAITLVGGSESYLLYDDDDFILQAGTDKIII